MGTKRLWFSVFVLTVLLLSFLILLSFALSRPHNFGNNGEDFVNVSDEGTASHYRFGQKLFECSGLCYCDENNIERRNGITSSHGRNVISLFFISLSSVIAFKMSKELLNERCENELSDSCSPQSIQSEVLDCQDYGEEYDGCTNSECFVRGKKYLSVFSDEGDFLKERDYLEDIQGYNVRRRYPKPKKSALIVIDMQNSFSWLKDDVLGNVRELIGSCYDSGMKVIFTRYGFKKDGSGGKVMRTWWGDLAEYGSYSWELFDEMKEIIEEKLENDCHIVDKEGYNSFHDTDLDTYLTQNGIEEVVIVGVTTNCCCASTARAAFDHGYKNYVISDATAGTSEEQHIEQLKILSFATSYVISTRQLLEYLSNGEL